MDEVEQVEDVTVRLAFEPEAVAVIAITGEVDIASVGMIRATIAEAVASNAERIVFDLSGVEFLDSSGIATLIESRSATRSVSLRAPSAPVQRLIVTTGLATILPVEP